MTQTTIKSIAKSIGASLKAMEYSVPHSVLLHAVSNALSGQDWHALKKQLAVGGDTPASTVTPAPATDVSDSGVPVVPAEFRTDDHAFSVSFDAVGYLSQAPASKLARIIEVGYSGDPVTDEIAEYPTGDPAVETEIRAAFAYLDAINGTGRRETVGYEVYVDGEAMLRWMDANRRVALAHLLCKRHDVSIVEAQKDEFPGICDWICRSLGEASEFPLFSADEAALDAYATLDLLEQEIKDSPYIG